MSKLDRLVALSASAPLTSASFVNPNRYRRIIRPSVKGSAFPLASISHEKQSRQVADAASSVAWVFAGTDFRRWGCVPGGAFS